MGTYPRPIHPKIRNKLLAIAYYYIFKGMKVTVVHKKLMKAKIILHFIGEDHIFFEVCRAIRYMGKEEANTSVSLDVSIISNFSTAGEIQKSSWYKKTYKAYRSLDDMFILREFGITAEYADALFDFFDLKFRVMNTKEILNHIE